MRTGTVCVNSKGHRHGGVCGECVQVQYEQTARTARDEDAVSAYGYSLSKANSQGRRAPGMRMRRVRTGTM